MSLTIAPSQLKLSTTPTPAPPLESSTFLSLMKLRRSVYKLTPTLPVSFAKIQNVVAEAVMHTPSCYNSQTNRAVVLLGDHHTKFWNMVADLTLPTVPESKRAYVEGRFVQFRDTGAGSILFWEDHDVLNEYCERFNKGFDQLKSDAIISDGMLQFSIWTALAADGVGANIQHNVGDNLQAAVRREWDLPECWHMNAQMVFGGIAGQPMDKTFNPLEGRLKVFA